MNIYIIFILLIILIIVAALLLLSIARDTKLNSTIGDTIIGGDENDNKVNGGENFDKNKKIYIVDGLNYINSQFLTLGKSKNTEGKENLISKYPNSVYIWKAITKLKTDHKNSYIVFVIKNQDNYKLSVYDDNLFKRWAKTYKIGIIVCYDHSKLVGEHYVKGRDDKVVCELYDKYKILGVNSEIISNDAFEDKSYFANIPPFKKIIYGFIPFLDKIQ